MSHYRLKNKLAIITGAAQGIGVGIAEIFFNQGCNLILLDINSTEETKRKLIKETKLKGRDIPSITCLKCDLTKESNIIDMTKIITKKFGKNSINILVNNAAIFVLKNIIETSADEWSKMLMTNIRGYALMIKYIVPIMAKNGSSIVNIGSISSFRAQGPNMTPYNVTKAGILQLTKNCAADLWNDDYKIRVNCVCPGPIITPAHFHHFNTLMEKKLVKNYDEFYKQCVETCIIKECGTIQDVGNACLFFASDNSKYTTGSHLMVDGGFCSL